MCLFGNKRKETDPDTVIIRAPGKNECGGTTETLDRKAPKEIDSHDVVLFNVESSLGGGVFTGDGDEEKIRYVNAFAAPSGTGTFVFYESSQELRRRGEPESRWAFIRENASRKLDELTTERGFVKANGHHSKTHGLPENFGGEVEIEYANGQKISFSDNQTPVISTEDAKAIDVLFKKLLDGEKVILPNIAYLTQIEFEEKRSDGGFTRACLTFNADGTGTNRKQAKYSDTGVFESEKPVDAETVKAIRNNIEKCGLLAWPALPESPYKFSGQKTLGFIFEDGTKIVVPNDRVTPDRINRGFFNIELEMTTKH